MPAPPKCCNPFDLERHNNVKTKLSYLSENHDVQFRNLFGSYVCSSCKRLMYRKKDSFNFKKRQAIEAGVEYNEKENKDDEEEIESVNSVKDADFVCKSVDNENKRRKLAAAFQEVIMAPPSKKQNINLSDSDFLRKTLNNNNILNDNDVNNGPWIHDFKNAISRASTRAQKIVLLTTLPFKWSIRKTAKEFGVSRRMVSSARKLLNEKGYCAQPDKKKGRAMGSDLIDKVTEFYYSDEVSRVQPGVRDYKSVKINGKRHHKTVCSIELFISFIF